MLCNAGSITSSLCEPLQTGAGMLPLATPRVGVPIITRGDLMYYRPREMQVQSRLNVLPS